jgi:hypothetical protein
MIMALKDISLIGKIFLPQTTNIPDHQGNYTAFQMKKFVSWDIKTQFILHRKHIKSRLERAPGKCYV